MTVPKRAESVVLVSVEDVEGGKGGVLVTTSQTKVTEVVREFLKDFRLRLLDVISGYIGRRMCE